MQVQFQAMWALANLSARRRIRSSQEWARVRETAQNNGVVLEPGVTDLGAKLRGLIVRSSAQSRRLLLGGFLFFWIAGLAH